MMIMSSDMRSVPDLNIQSQQSRSLSFNTRSCVFYQYVSACVGVNPVVTRTALDTASRTPCAGHSRSQDGCQAPLHPGPFARWSEQLPNYCYPAPPRPHRRQSRQSPADRSRCGFCHAVGSSRMCERLICAGGWSVGSQTTRHRGST